MTPDNRIRFPGPKIDFDTEVGTTGQDHDTYPAANTQPRYDWLRMVLIGLLANQSSYTAPNNYREGTLWFDLTTNILKIRSGNSWQDLSACIGVTVDGTQLSLSSWVSQVSAAIVNVYPEVTFSGSCQADTIYIPVPSSLQALIDVNYSRPFLYKNGLLVAPTLTVFQGITHIKLLGVTLDAGDTFTVVIKRFISGTFYTENVVV